MTLTKWTSIFIALAFALPLVSAVFDQLGLNYNLRSMIYVDSLRQTFSLEYSISHSYALTWTVRAAGTPARAPPLPQDARLYRGPANLLLFTSPTNMPPNMQGDTTIEIAKFREAADATYICVHDIFRGTGSVYSSPSFEDDVPEGYMRLGVDILASPIALVGLEVNPRFRQVTVIVVEPPQREFFGICKCISRSILSVGVFTHCGRALESFRQENRIGVVALEAGMAIAMFGLLGGMEIAYQVCNAALNADSNSNAGPVG